MKKFITILFILCPYILSNCSHGHCGYIISIVDCQRVDDGTYYFQMLSAEVEKEKDKYEYKIIVEYDTNLTIQDVRFYKIKTKSEKDCSFEIDEVIIYNKKAEIFIYTNTPDYMSDLSIISIVFNSLELGEGLPEGNYNVAFHINR